MKETPRRVVGIAALLWLSLLLPLCAWSQTLKQVATIDLPGPKGQRFDYLTVDDEDHYLLSHETNDFAVRLSQCSRNSLRVDIHRRANIRMPQELLLHLVIRLRGRIMNGTCPF